MCLRLYTKPQCVAIQTNALKQYFHVVLFISSDFVNRIWQFFFLPTVLILGPLELKKNLLNGSLLQPEGNIARYRVS